MKRKETVQNRTIFFPLVKQKDNFIFNIKKVSKYRKN